MPEFDPGFALTTALRERIEQIPGWWAEAHREILRFYETTAKIVIVGDKRMAQGDTSWMEREARDYADARREAAALYSVLRILARAYHIPGHEDA